MNDAFVPLQGFVPKRYFPLSGIPTKKKKISNIFYQKTKNNNLLFPSSVLHVNSSFNFPFVIKFISI